MVGSRDISEYIMAKFLNFAVCVSLELLAIWLKQKRVIITRSIT
jgi:hypothetical protein